jgi:hypothetical protein
MPACADQNWRESDINPRRSRLAGESLFFLPNEPGACPDDAFSAFAAETAIPGVSPDTGL